MKKIRLLFKLWGVLLLAGLLNPSVILAVQSSEVDVTSTYITNAGFDASCNYLFDAVASNLGSANGGVNIQAVSGWTIGTTGDNSAASSFEYGYAGTLNSPGNIPATDPDGASGTGEGTLGVSVAWEGSVTYFQTATLPAGTYKLKYKAYNTGAVTYDKSLVGWVPDAGTASLSSIVDFQLNTWTSDVVTFTVTAETAGKLQIGLEAKAAGSGGNGRIFFDDIQLLYTAAILSDDATLSNLTTTVGELSPAFDIATTDYILLVPSSTQSLVLVSTVTDAGASAVGDGEITLTDGIGAASIVVTAENGDPKTYNVSIDANDCYTPHYSDRKNLIADPTFSASSLAAGGFSGWGPTGIIAKGAYCGKGSAHIRGNCWPDGGSLDRKLTTANGNALKPNTTYQLRAMVNSKAAAGTSFQFQVEGYDGTESIFYQLENTNGWMQFDKKFTTGATITEMGIYFNSCTNKPLITDSCFLDNYELFVAPMKISASELAFAGAGGKDITVTGQELTEGIVISATAGFSVSTTDLASDVVDGVVTVTYDGVATANGYVYLTSGIYKDSVAVSGTADPTIVSSVKFLTFDELLPTGSFKVSGGNLSDSIRFELPSGYSVIPEVLSPSASDVEVTVVFDGSADSKGDIIIKSGSISTKVRVIGSLNSTKFTPAQPSGNLISNVYFNDLTGYTGWGSRNITKDTLEVYSGVGSFKTVGACGGSLDYSLNGLVEANSTYRLRAMVKTTNEFKFIVNGCDVKGSANHFLRVDTEGEWKQVDFMFTTGTLAANQNIYFNSCEGFTGTEAFIDNLELYLIPTKKVAYVTFAKDMAETASPVAYDPIIRLLQADPLFDVTVLAVADNAEVDLAGYDLAVVQEGFGSGSQIFTPAGSLALEKIAIPFVYNKAYALRNGKAVTSTTSSAGEIEGQLHLAVEAANQTNPLFSGMTFVGDSVKLFNTGAADNGDASRTKALAYTLNLEMSDATTLLGATKGAAAGVSVCVNDIPAGTILGTQDTLQARMIALCMNFGAISKDNGMDITADGLTLWRNAIYLAGGFPVPTTAAVAPAAKGLDATLDTITVSVGTLAPDFDAATLSYTLSVPYGTDSVAITGVANDSKASVEGNGYVKVTNSGSIKVIAENGINNKTYAVTISVEAPIIKKVAYVTFAKDMAETASPVAYDPIIRLLQADPLFDVTVLAVADNAEVDLTGYDLAVVQEGFGSGSQIFTPAGSLALEKIAIPFVYNKAYALRNGKAITSTTSSAGEIEGQLHLAVEAANQSNPLFSGITFVGDSVKLFNTGAADNGDASRTKALAYTLNLEMSDATTLLGATKGAAAGVSVCVNDIPAGTILGTQDTLQARMIALCMNFGAISKDNGMDITAEGLTLWRNAIYLAAGLTVPTTIAIAPEAKDLVTTLNDLAVSVGELSPAFDAATLSYTVTVPIGTASVDVTPTTTDANATTEGSGTIDLVAGTGTATVVVTAENGISTKTYTVVITVESNGVTTSEAASVKVTPTVSTADFKVAAVAGSVINVYDITGQLITSVVAVSNTTSVDVPQAGIYMVKVGSSVTKVIKID